MVDALQFRCRSSFRFATLSLLLLICTIATAQPTRGSNQARNPLNPLSAAERQTAERIAAGDSRVREMAAAGRVRLVYVELANAKPEGEAGLAGSGEQGRFAEVLQYRVDDDSGIRTLVDLQRNEVRAVERVEGSSVPLSPAELDEAVKLALGSSEVRDLLGAEATQYVVPPPAATRNAPYAIRALLVHSLSDTDPCYRRRCVHLMFQRRGAYLTDTVIADLTNRGVRIERGTR